MVIVAGLSVLPACTSNSAGDSAADSSATPTATTVSESPPPSPAPPARIETEKGNRSVSEKLSDATTETTVKQALVGTSSLTVFPFTPTVVNGHLVLRGDVNTLEQYRQAERVARQVDAVKTVTNQLTMGGRPVTKERLNSDDEDASKEDAAVYHTVRQGDTLWDIARQYRASVQQIRNLNEFQSSNLRPGQRIRIR